MRNHVQGRMRTIGTLLFDIDGTLFDRTKAQEAILDIIVAQMPDPFARLERGALSRAFAASDRCTCEEYGAGLISMADFRARRSQLFLELLELDNTCAATVTELFVARYPTLDAPIRGAKALVRALANSFLLGVVSDGFPVVQQQKLRAIGVLHCFHCIVLSEDTGLRKPDPRIFLHAASLLGVQPASCLYIGDLFERDVVGAKLAGMRACWFNPKQVQVDTRCTEVAPDAEIQDLAQLWGVLADIECRSKSPPISCDGTESRDLT